MDQERKEPPKLVIFPWPDLFKRAQPIGKFGEELLKLEATLIEAMRYYEGVGLAACQLLGAGQWQIFVMVDLEDLTKTITIVNPKIKEEGPWIKSPEGCLSLPGVTGSVMRHEWIRLQYMDTKGNVYDRTFSGFQARVVQHEWSHLLGGTIYERMDTETRKANASNLALLVGPYYDCKWLPRHFRRLARNQTHKAHRKTYG